MMQGRGRRQKREDNIAVYLSYILYAFFTK